jgi:Ca2+-transporting ATPase
LHPGLILVSGAPEVVWAKCQNADAKFQKLWESEAKKGHRIVGFAYKNLKSKISHLEPEHVSQLTWLGILVYDDPIRKGVKEVLEQARKEGIKIKLITGDYKETALAVGAQLGFKPSDVYSRVAPEEKLRIVKELQDKGEVVAMTGDGVNDAPALKKADIGIVVADASAVATETADMVLLDSNFATILAAVEEGRLIFANLVKVLYYLMAHAFAEVVVIAGSILLNLPLPMTAAQILWINLINDSWPTFALVLDPKDGHEGKRELFSPKTKLSVILISSLTGLMALVLFAVYRSQSLAFSMIAIAPLIFSFSIGSLKNLYLIGAAVIGFLLQILVLYVPAFQAIFHTRGLAFYEWGLVIGGSLLVVGVMELVKRYDRR